MNKIFASLLGAVAVLGASTMLFSAGSSDAANITFIGRGIVKGGGDANNINVYWTFVPTSVERIAGVRTDVDMTTATKYQWIVSNGALSKDKTGTRPTPEKEVVIRGVLKDNDVVSAVWSVVNYRQFKVTGKLQGIEMDTGKADAGWATIKGSTSYFRNVTPNRIFKAAKMVGKDVVIRINGLTEVTSEGNSKTLEEVTANQQTVTIEGEVLNEDHWAVSKFNEN